MEIIHFNKSVGKMKFITFLVGLSILSSCVTKSIYNYRENCLSKKYFLESIKKNYSIKDYIKDLSLHNISFSLDTIMVSGFRVYSDNEMEVLIFVCLGNGGFGKPGTCLTFDAKFLSFRSYNKLNSKTEFDFNYLRGHNTDSIFQYKSNGKKVFICRGSTK